jgi:hypothetical protein
MAVARRLVDVPVLRVSIVARLREVEALVRADAVRDTVPVR